MKRRVLLQVVAATPILTGLGCSATARGTTQSQQTGPYYPPEPIPLRNDLILNEDYTGEQLILQGKVLGLDSDPVPRVRVEIWQCDAKGVYPHPDAPDNERFDAAFAGQGATITDASGQYRFRTIMPVPYTGRPPHIHVRLKAEQRILLTTQLYLQGSGGADSLKIAPDSTDSDNRYEAQFDFTVEV